MCTAAVVHGNISHNIRNVSHDNCIFCLWTHHG